MTTYTQDIQIVTAFFEIDRSSWKNFPRSTDQYFSAFKQYLNIPYKIILFLDDRFLEKIPKNHFIQIIPINRHWLEMYLSSWKKFKIVDDIMKSENYKKLLRERISMGYPENLYPEYNLINLSKTDFVNYVIENNLSKSKFICWSDFGYFESIYNMNPIRFPIGSLDIQKFNNTKMNFFLVNPIEQVDYSIFKTLKYPRETIVGTFFGGPIECWKEFYKLLHEQIDDFISKEIMDDDQHLYLRCYSKMPELFELHIYKNVGCWPDVLGAFQITFSNRKELIKHYISDTNRIQKIVEIGIWEGDLTTFILENNSSCQVYCVDPYISYDDYKDAINYELLDKKFEETSFKLKHKFGDRIEMIRKFSKDAIWDIPDNLDFIYIDGNHSYKYVLEDIELWYPKLRPGGFIIGDDAVDEDDNLRNFEGDVYIEWTQGCFGHYGVIKAFKDYCDLKKLTFYKIQNQILLHKPFDY